MRSRYRTVAIASAVLAVLISGTAIATNFGGPKDAGKHCDTTLSSQCVAANGVHTVCIVNGTTAHKNATRNRIDHYDDMSFLIVTEVGAPCGNGFDVHVRDVNLPNTEAIAWTKCKSGATYGGSETPLPGTRWCMPQEFIWNTAYDWVIDSDTNKHMVACHEIGHTFGLRHRSKGASSCMVGSTIDPLYVNPWTVTDSHDRAHLDARY